MISRVLIGLAVLLAVGTFVVRASNDRHATSLAAAITTQDTAGADTTAAQAGLASYVKSHMGAHVSYTLTGSYNSALAAAKAAAAAQTANSQIYAAAQAACSGKTDSITQAKCNQAYLSQHLTSQPTPTQVTSPVLADYIHTLTAPIWTPDAAGALAAGGLVALIAGIIGLRKGKRS